MQRVSGFLPSWERRPSASKASAQPPANSFTNRISSNGGLASAFFGWGARAPSVPNDSNTLTVKKLAHINVAAANSGRVQREAFWPATLDQECEKAARILKSFCGTSALFLALLCSR